jgi:hypothetical protein
MNKIKRVLVSMIVAITVSLLTVFAVLAGGPYYVTDASLTRVDGPSGTPIPTTVATPGCRGTGANNCHYLIQASNPSHWRWSILSNNVYYWYVYVPAVGQAAMWVAPYYENWSTVVNQANVNNQKTFVYIGYSDNLPNSNYFLEGSDQCNTGWYCGGLKLYWDDMGYTTSP